MLRPAARLTGADLAAPGAVKPFMTLEIRCEDGTETKEQVGLDL